ncbi:MAG: hypothetical protein LBR84_01905 [Tannerella sp.]|nr:hypothetical protein [Tannerella sp.]
MKAELLNCFTDWPKERLAVMEEEIRQSRMKTINCFEPCNDGIESEDYFMPCNDVA